MPQILGDVERHIHRPFVITGQGWVHYVVAHLAAVEGALEKAESADVGSGAGNGFGQQKLAAQHSRRQSPVLVGIHRSPGRDAGGPSHLRGSPTLIVEIQTAPAVVNFLGCEPV